MGTKVERSLPLLAGQGRKPRRPKPRVGARVALGATDKKKARTPLSSLLLASSPPTQDDESPGDN